MKTNRVDQKQQHQNYRVCYEGGSSATGKKIYELYKYCDCSGCKDRLTYKRGTRNQATATTKDILKIDKVADFLKNWTCEDEKRELDNVYFKF
jgi:hypothetical protein